LLHFGERLSAPPVNKPLNRIARGLGLLAGRDFAGVLGQDVGDEDLRRTTVARGLVFCRDVFPEPRLSSCALFKAAACAALDRSVTDEPVACPPVKPEPGAFRWTRHFSLISLSAARVTKSRRPIRSITRLPRDASARNVAGLIVPRKTISHASARVIGSSSPMSSGRASGRVNSHTSLGK
jgi:hypothetical protein